MRQFLASLIAVCCLLGCAKRGVDTPIFHAETNPDLLSDWKVLRVENQTLVLADNVIPYDLNSSLFTDYAHKLRTIWVPEGLAAEYQETAVFEFPIGTIISKTFYYPHAPGAGADSLQLAKAPDKTAELLTEGFDLNRVRLIETRLLIRRADGWAALPYVWNKDQTDARLKRAGDIKSLQLVSAENPLAGSPVQDFNYIVPNVNQCAGCHATNATTRDIHPIGPAARHLNKSFAYKTGAKNQILAWQDIGVLSPISLTDNIPKNVNWEDISSPLNARARAYLDINCAHCHNPVGPADTSGLNLEAHSPDGPSLGTCKLPIAAGTGTGDRAFDIIPGKPEESIFTFRMESTNPAVMMPELGRSLSHTEGVELIAQWIAQMEGACEAG